MRLPALLRLAASDLDRHYMRITQLRRADLNLLVVFVTLADERNVSRAGRRLSLSQPAVTRALQRLREMFRDDLLIRTEGKYDFTPKGFNLFQELQLAFPRIDHLLGEAGFNPRQEEAKFRLAGSDYASHVICPSLGKHLLAMGSSLSFDLWPLQKEAVDAIEHGRIDLLLNCEGAHIPGQFLHELLFKEELVCVVAKESPYPDRFSLRDYLAALHISVSTFDGRQTVIEDRLAAKGLERQSALRVPYFSMALHSVVGTNLVATVPKRISDYDAHRLDVRIAEAPSLLRNFEYHMTWHRRMDLDAAHLWLRQAIHHVCRSIPHAKR